MKLPNIPTTMHDHIVNGWLFGYGVDEILEFINKE